MAMKASFFRIARDFDLPAGSMIQHGKDWLLRSKLVSQNEEQAAALWLSGDGLGTFQLLESPSRCVTLDPALKLELRIDGFIEGPSGAPLGSLTWSEDGLSQAICAADGRFMTIDGVSSKQFLGPRAFFARNWSIWIVDKDGKDIAGGPLVTVNL